MTQRDLIFSELDHPWAGNWYYALQLGPLEHKLPPIVAHRWRRVTFIVTSGDRFVNAHEINHLFEQESPASQLYVRLEELGIQVEREWWMDEDGTAYLLDLALPLEHGWLPVTFGDRPGRWPAICRRGRAGSLSAGDPDQAAYLQVKLREIDIPVKREWLTMSVTRRWAEGRVSWFDGIGSGIEFSP